MLKELKLPKVSLFQIWIVVTFAIIAGFIGVASKGIKVNSDILRIFNSPTNSDADEASRIFEKKFEDDLIVFVRHENREHAIAHAEQVFQQMSKQEIYSDLKFKSDKANPTLPMNTLFQHRKNLLTAEQKYLIQTNQTATLVQKALNQVYSPTGLGSQIVKDPLGLFQDYVSGLAGSIGVSPSEGYLISERPLNDRNGFAVMIRAKLNKAIYDFNERLLSDFDTAKELAARNNFEVYFLAASLFAAHGAETSMNEVKLYGTLSFLAISSLLMWIFSSPTPIVASLLTILLSVVTGLLAVTLTYSQVHVLSLLMAISILGIVTDYCTHFFSKGFDESIKSGSEAIAKIKTALALGFLTNILTYLCFYFADLEILKQLSVFVCAGIMITYLTVLAVFPKFKWKQLNLDGLSRLSNLSAFWQNSRSSRYFLLVLGLILVAGLLSGQVKFDDNVKLLQGLSSELKKDEESVHNLLGTSGAMSFVLVKGKTPDEVLAHEEQISEKLRASGVPFFSLSKLIPSLKSQQESFELYQTLEDEVDTFFEKIGVPDPNMGKEIFKLNSGLIYVEEFLKESSDLPLSANWLGKIGEHYFSAINITSDLSPELLSTLETSESHVVNRVAQATQLLKTLRQTITQQFAIVLCILWLVLLILYRLRKSLRIIFPPLFSALCTLVITGIYFGHLNLFNLMAVILIFCLGMDYSVFFAQSKGSHASTHVGVFISVLSTIGSFGVLALSSTHAVSSFGLSVFIGITLCYFLSPIAAGKA